MVAKVISGREVAETILTTDLKNKVIELNKQNIKPKLIVILVGDMKASASYVAQKEKFAVKAGIESDVMRFEDSITETEILDQIDAINKDKSIHDILCTCDGPELSFRSIIDSSPEPQRLHDASINWFPSIMKNHLPPNKMLLQKGYCYYDTNVVFQILSIGL